MDVTRLTRRGGLNAETMAQILTSRRTEAVMVYDSWFGSTLPGILVPVGTWTTTDNYFDPIVAFYGTSPAAAHRLREAFRRFSPSLPRSVTVTECQSSPAEVGE
jgi:hypothetical protein